MAGELLGLLVVWALIFTLPVVVAWTAIRIVVAAQEVIEERRIPPRVPTSRGDARKTGPATREATPDSDTFDTELDDVQGRVSTDSRRRREED